MSNLVIFENLIITFSQVPINSVFCSNPINGVAIGTVNHILNIIKASFGLSYDKSFGPNDANTNV